MINKLRKLDLVIASVITVLTVAAAIIVGVVLEAGWLFVLLTVIFGLLEFTLWEGILFAIGFVASSLQNTVYQALSEDEDYEDEDYDGNDYDSDDEGVD